ncbi:MAG TPA: peptidoglycan DD-metalloendopeptidase family protein [Burkholderiales bacterium]|nr:peptidoglycan DD-metalloendopeptidase family protein [Burkholderiales bacterium]
MMRVAHALLALCTVVAGCTTTRSPAPVDDRRPPVQAKAPAAKPAPARAGIYTVKRGDTLYSIALEHGIDYRDLARWNGIDDPSRIRIGQGLRVSAPEDKPAPGVQVGSVHPSGEVEARPLGAPPGAPSAAAPAVAGLKTSPTALRLPYSEQNLAALSKAEPAKPAAPAGTAPPPAALPAAPAAAERAADALDFVWPAKGRVVAGFAEPRSKGVDIAGNAGDPVVAAAAGRVIYVGQGIPGLGKFIVVRHDNGFNTVYAHNRENLVKMDQTIARGQKIAEMGSTDTDSPKLHFQIRKFGTPLDPLKYLPSGVP